MKEVYKKIIAIIILILMIVNSSLLTIISVAVDNIDDNNVFLNTYFIDTNGDKTEDMSVNMSAEDIKLGIEIGLSNQGYFNGEIQLKNSNFKFKTDFSSEYISGITENSIKLNQIKAGEKIVLELGIEPIKDDNYELSMLDRITEIMVLGNYAISQEESKDVYKSRNVRLSLNNPYSGNEESEVNLQAQVVTNKIYEIDGTNKRIFQMEVDSSVLDNLYPIKSTKLTIDVFDGVEDVKVSRRGTYATNNDNREINQNWDKEKRELEINIENNENEGRIQWNKTQSDKILITYILDYDFIVENIETKIKNEIVLYDETNSILTKEIVISDSAEKDGILSYNMSGTSSLYKGNMYYGEDTNFAETSILDIRYPKLVSDISINQGNSKYVSESRESDANSLYVATIISKDNLANILGDSGVLNINDINGNVLGTMTKKDAQDKEEHIELSYEGQNSIIIQVHNAENEGVLNLVHKKVLRETGYNKNQMKTFTGIKAQGSLQTEKNIEVKVAETKTDLVEPESYATITSNVNELTTLQLNENVEFNVILKTDDIKYDLYKNPSVEIVFPKEISVIKAQMNPIFVEGFELTEAIISQNENGNSVLKIALVGEQQSHSNNINEGIIININASLQIDKSVSTKDSEIIMYYTNQNVGTETFERRLPIRLKSKEGLLVYNKTENFNENNDVIESISNDVNKGNLDIGTDKRVLTDKILLVNNYEEEISNVTIIEKNVEETNTKLLLNSPVIVNSGNAKVYYTEDEINWVEDINSLSEISAYKIELDSMDAGSNVETVGGFEIAEGLSYGKNAKLSKEVIYSVQGQEFRQLKMTELETETELENRPKQEVTVPSEEEDSSEIEASIIEVSTEATLGNKKLTLADTVYEGEIITNIITIKSNSKTDIKNVKVVANQQNAVIYDIVEIEVTNPSITGSEDEILIEHNYGDWETGEKVFDTIDVLKAGETKTISYQARVNEVEGTDNQTFGDITIEADNLEKMSKQTIKNGITQGKIKMTLKNSFNEEVKKYDGESVNTGFYIKNIQDTDVENINIEIQLSDNYYIDDKTKDIKFYNDIDEWTEVEPERIENLQYDIEKHVIRFNITKLNVNEEFTIVMEPIADNVDKEKESEIATVSASASIGEEHYYSNIIQKEIIYIGKTFDLEYSIKDQKEQYYDGEQITFVIKATNNTKSNAFISLNNDMSGEFEVVSATKFNNGTSVDFIEEIEDNIFHIVEEEVEAGKSIIIEIVATVDYSEDEGDSVINEVEMFGNGINLYKELKINLAGEKDNENNTSKDEKISISGVVWNDKNRDGKRDITEKGLENIEVRLVTEKGEFAVDSEGNIISTKTNSLGEYKFEVKKGKYIVLFLYNDDEYAVTEYKKENIDESLNSDVIRKEIIMDGKNRIVAITDMVDVTKDSIMHIDAGFYERQKFDLKLDKYITKVNFVNKSETKQYEFNKEKLAKVEIKAKQFVGTTIAIEYEIQITNEGEIEGFVNDVVDYIPEGLNFSSEINKDWYLGTDKNLHNISLENEKLGVGQTKTLKLVLTKTIDSASGQTLMNIAEINKANNSENIADKDSIPGNKVNGEDDMSSASLIISISTGATKILLGIMILVLIIILIILFIIKKKGGFLNEKNKE